MRWRFFLAGLSIVAAFSGCSGRQTGNANAPTASNFASATPIVEASAGQQRSALIGRNAVDVKDLALPLYPGAIPAETGALLMHSKNGVSRVMSLSTKDDFEKVYQWYKQQMPAGSEQTHMAAPHGSIASFLIGKAQDLDSRSVLITQSGNKTVILLSRQTKPAGKAQPPRH